jgi:hypothetical protein
MLKFVVFDLQFYLTENVVKHHKPDLLTTYVDGFVSYQFSYGTTCGSPKTLSVGVQSGVCFMDGTVSYSLKFSDSKFYSLFQHSLHLNVFFSSQAPAATSLYSSTWAILVITPLSPRCRSTVSRPARRIRRGQGRFTTRCRACARSDPPRRYP